MEEGWGWTNRRIFQNLLRVLYYLAHLPHVCANKTELVSWSHPMFTIFDEGNVSRPEVKTKKGEIWKLLSWEEGNSNFVIYTGKAKWSPNLDEGVQGFWSFKRKPRTQAFWLKDPNSLDTTAVVMAVLQVSHDQELCYICCLLLHNKPPWNT